MSTLTVVRHAQARPFQKDSDRLSELGEAQARTLGEYWRHNGIAFDEVWSGSLKRHRQTAALALDQPPQISPGWNEYDVDGVMRDYPRPSSFPNNREFQKVFETAMLKWVDGAIGEAEPWDLFQARVRAALRTIQEGPSNRRVVLFTSGGPIGVLVQTVLRAPGASFLDVNWRVRNCSVSEFVFSADRFSLDSFNSVAHLPEQMRTFR
jgi:broad specificity phosphatase PhoE